MFTDAKRYVLVLWTVLIFGFVSAQVLEEANAESLVLCELCKREGTKKFKPAKGLIPNSVLGSVQCGGYIHLVIL